MNIQPISTNYQRDFSCNNYSKNVSFKSYKETLARAVTSDIKNDSQAEKLFSKLFKELLEEKEIKVNEAFNAIKNVYEQSGFRGLLNALWKSKPQEDVAKIVEESNQNCVPLVTKQGETLMEIFSFGKQGFSSNATNDVKISFHGPKDKNTLEFGLGKKANVLIDQSNGETLKSTEYYTSSGTKKCETINSGGLPPERTFYNEDGSKPFFKNWFFGGAVYPVN